MKVIASFALFLSYGHLCLASPNLADTQAQISSYVAQAEKHQGSSIGCDIAVRNPTPHLTTVSNRTYSRGMSF